MKISGTTAVVIGGGSGVGRGIAMGLANAGARIVVADIDESAAETVAAQIRAGGQEASAYGVDATDRASLARLAADAADGHGALSILVNTVGAIVDRPLVDSTESDWGWIGEFNVMAMLRSVQEFLPQLRAADGPKHIVLTSSMAGLLVLGPDLVPIANGLYTTTKHALIGLAETLRMELASEQIGVSVLCPGLVAGNLSQTSARNRPDRFGGPLPIPPATDRSATRAMPHEAVGPIVAAAIEHNRFYIFTHPEVRSMIEARHHALLADLEFAAERGNA